MRCPVPKLRTLLWRGFNKKCPRCGQGPIYKRWIKMRNHCSECGLHYLPDQGDLWGPLVFLDRVLFIIPLVVLFYFRVRHPNWTLFVLVGGLTASVLIFTVPHRLGMSLAIDYLIRRKAGDLSDEANVPPP